MSTWAGPQRQTPRQRAARNAGLGPLIAILGALMAPTIGMEPRQAWHWPLIASGVLFVGGLLMFVSGVRWLMANRRRPDPISPADGAD